MPHHPPSLPTASLPSIRLGPHGVELIDSGGQLVPVAPEPAALDHSLLHRHGQAIGIASIVLGAGGGVGGSTLVFMLGLPLVFLLPPTLLALVAIGAGVWLIRSRRSEPPAIEPLLTPTRQQGGTHR